MQATLNVVTKILAFADEQINSNPRLQYVNWLRDISGITVTDPKSEAHKITPGTTLDLFDGTRATTIDSSTAFDIALLPIDGASRYRITWVGGTDPSFRTGRGLTPTGMTITFTVQTNASVLVASSAALFGSVVAGDEVFVPGTTTGDAANVLSVLNEGYWTVLAKTDAMNIVLARPTGQDFVAVTESVVLTSNNQLRAYSAAGVQIGDTVDISDGFALATQKTYEILTVTDKFIEITSTTPLPDQSGIIPNAGVVLIIPTPPGMVIYKETKQFLYIESSQDLIVRVNGDTGSFQRITPMDSSDPLKPGVYMRRGPTWTLSLYNRSATTAEVTIIHCE